eukprot:m.32186 g.32186  ORF g.32186 m.32186 type:complete len:107 (-) comp16597_c0_seq1:79-399(-)
MVCGKCTKKLAKLGAPDVFGKNPNDKSSNTIAGGGRKLNENKLLGSGKNKFKPFQKFRKCKICKCTINQANAHYCQGCAYKIGICAMCGKQIISDKQKETSKQSST